MIIIKEGEVDDSQDCVTISTGTEAHNSGTLMVTINGVVASIGDYGIGDVVMRTCLTELKNMTLTNPSTDAWVGQIVITESGRRTWIDCDGCSGSSYKENICVDGDSTCGDMSTTQCLNGRTCPITWSRKGTFQFFLFQFKVINGKK